MDANKVWWVVTILSVFTVFGFFSMFLTCTVSRSAHNLAAELKRLNSIDALARAGWPVKWSIFLSTGALERMTIFERYKARRFEMRCLLWGPPSWLRASTQAHAALRHWRIGFFVIFAIQAVLMLGFLFVWPALPFFRWFLFSVLFFEGLLFLILRPWPWGNEPGVVT